MRKARSGALATLFCSPDKERVTTFACRVCSFAASSPDGMTPDEALAAIVTHLGANHPEVSRRGLSYGECDRGERDVWTTEPEP